MSESIHWVMGSDISSNPTVTVAAKYVSSDKYLDNTSSYLTELPGWQAAYIVFNRLGYNSQSQISYPVNSVKTCCLFSPNSGQTSITFTTLSGSSTVTYTDSIICSAAGITESYQRYESVWIGSIVGTRYYFYREYMIYYW